MRLPNPLVEVEDFTQAGPDAIYISWWWVLILLAVVAVVLLV